MVTTGRKDLNTSNRISTNNTIVKSVSWWVNERCQVRRRNYAYSRGGRAGTSVTVLAFGVSCPVDCVSLKLEAITY